MMNLSISGNTAFVLNVEMKFQSESFFSTSRSPTCGMNSYYLFSSMIRTLAIEMKNPTKTFDSKELIRDNWLIESMYLIFNSWKLVFVRAVFIHVGCICVLKEICSSFESFRKDDKNVCGLTKCVSISSVDRPPNILIPFNVGREFIAFSVNLKIISLDSTDCDFSIRTRQSRWFSKIFVCFFVCGKWWKHPSISAATAGAVAPK